MAFKIFKPKTRKRIDECKEMFEVLASEPDSCAVIDLERSHLFQYAKKLGYKITTQYVDYKKTRVWVVGKADE